MAATVLIVDDHAGFRLFARAMLEADGFDVVGEATDGTAALAAVRALAPEIVLMDIALPDLDANEPCITGLPKLTPLVVRFGESSPRR